MGRYQIRTETEPHRTVRTGETKIAPTDRISALYLLESTVEAAADLKLPATAYHVRIWHHRDGWITYRR